MPLLLLALKRRQPLGHIVPGLLALAHLDHGLHDVVEAGAHLLGAVAVAEREALTSRGQAALPLWSNSRSHCHSSMFISKLDAAALGQHEDALGTFDAQHALAHPASSIGRHGVACIGKQNHHAIL